MLVSDRWNWYLDNLTLELNLPNRCATQPPHYISSVRGVAFQAATTLSSKVLELSFCL